MKHYAPENRGAQADTIAMTEQVWRTRRSIQGNNRGTWYTIVAFSEESKMKRIAHHPNVEWPPDPTGGSFAKGEEALPCGQGVLKEVVAAKNSKDAEVEIILEHRGKDHHAWITIKNKDVDFASMLRSELGKWRGLPIEKIGEKEIAD